METILTEQKRQWTTYFCRYLTDLRDYYTSAEHVSTAPPSVIPLVLERMSERCRNDAGLFLKEHPHLEHRYETITREEEKAKQYTSLFLRFQLSRTAPTMDSL